MLPAVTEPALSAQVRARYGHKSPYLKGGSSNNIGCDFCNMAVEYIRLALHNNKTTAEIEEVSLFCSQAELCWQLICTISAVSPYKYKLLLDCSQRRDVILYLINMCTHGVRARHSTMRLGGGAVAMCAQWTHIKYLLLIDLLLPCKLEQSDGVVGGCTSAHIFQGSQLKQDLATCLVHVYLCAQEVEGLCTMLDFGGPAMLKCAKVKSLPTISFKVAGKEFKLAPEQYVLKVDAGLCLPIAIFRCMLSDLVISLTFVHLANQMYLGLQAYWGI
eukprot:GHRR01021434.1.p1 GENE.GHRR01021434.1~~GHRR01021434.1.p1  ORF type:complete len:274 (-),score=37.52 GHRR01021434.1:1320-2141(-)